MCVRSLLFCSSVEELKFIEKEWNRIESNQSFKIYIKGHCNVDIIQPRHRHDAQQSCSIPEGPKGTSQRTKHQTIEHNITQNTTSVSI
jgi:hypothetical protein